MGFLFFAPNDLPAHRRQALYDLRLRVNAMLYALCAMRDFEVVHARSCIS